VHAARLDCRSMQIANHTLLPDGVFAELTKTLPAHSTLMELVAWGSRQTPPVVLQETVALDEYSHEVLVPWRENLWLVYSST
jgi:hypothetical protein